MAKFARKIIQQGFNMRISAIGYLLILIITWCVSSCSSTKFVPEGEYLLDKVHIKTDNGEYRSIDLQQYVRQRPNYKMFALNKTQLQIYNLSGKDSSRWGNRFIRKLGEPPVIYDSTMVHKTALEFSKLFVNKGYLNVNIHPEVKMQNKKAEVTYYINTNTPHRIHSVIETIGDSVISDVLYEQNQPAGFWLGESAASRATLIKPGHLFDRNILDMERQRVVDLLRNRGYYAFTKDYITYNADTTSVPYAVDLEMVVHPYREQLLDSDFKEAPHSSFHIDKVYIYTDYDPLTYANVSMYVPADTANYGDYTIYYGVKGEIIRPKVLLENCYILPRWLYAEKREELTYNAYSGLRALDNIRIRFQEKHRNDSCFLDCYIMAQPAKKQNFSVSVDGTNSAGNLGFASSLGYQHRNLFRGSETFGVKLTGAYESISENFSENYMEAGIQTTLDFPKFMFPFLSRGFKRRLRASTEFALSYNYQTRPEYNRILMSGGLRYLWRDRVRRNVQHQFKLLDINYVYLPRIDQQFLNNLPPNAALFSYTNQFIVGMGYSYSYSTFNPSLKRRDVHAFKASVESAGNALYGVSSMFNFPKSASNSYELFGIYYAQYFKGDVDYSKTIFIDRKNSFAWHIGAGVAYPYANSSVLPFEKRYYSGGANSVRGWAVRSLGPGSYKAIPGRTTFYEQSGDVRFDANIEYRSHLFWKLELAAYIDAGNIWTIRNYEGQEGGHFKIDNFYKEVALSYGLGVRLDFDFFLVRMDTGMKAYDPAQRGSGKWAFLNPNFSNNFAWHFAVGYPF